jgi:hypothetical protein
MTLSMLIILSTQLSARCKYSLRSIMTPPFIGQKVSNKATFPQPLYWEHFGQ